MFKNKKILFIAPSFFGYEKNIVQEMTSLGAAVDFFDERPFKSSMAKIMNRLDLKFFIRRNINRYFDNIVSESISRDYDFLFVISPETIDGDFVASIKDANPNITSILYMWDSFQNKINARKLIPHFDRVFSFDPKDHNLDSRINFLPLFYNHDFDANSCDLNQELSYSVSFAGTVHSDRVKLVKKVINQLENNGLKTFAFFYCPSRLLFLLKKIFTKEYDFIAYSEVSFKPMSKSEIKDVFLRSSAVIDIQHPGQTGLTMRSIEMLGLQKKLVTTNESIKEYDFFDERNIFVIDRDTPSIPNDFLDSHHSTSSNDVILKYSLNNWLKSIFNFDRGLH
ncbi:lipopolysaccharide biosynthesis protein [Vibrio splendidus]|uniref:Lipopolysaccharide biosynthesis protein n=1 Tax=Vibrio splendidus TaxID=29497 RepID=A0A7Y4D7L3_VIBSP|nr:lipopolysaccharide biosynthesis protein [Vibrio splendidus]NOJ13177.1 lipopolysaccharide biosynthesis protein [Vibrio splendidus]